MARRGVWGRISPTVAQVLWIVFPACHAVPMNYASGVSRCQALGNTLSPELLYKVIHRNGGYIQACGGGVNEAATPQNQTPDSEGDAHTSKHRRSGVPRMFRMCSFFLSRRDQSASEGTPNPVSSTSPASRQTSSRHGGATSCTPQGTPSTIPVVTVMDGTPMTGNAI